MSRREYPVAPLGGCGYGAGIGVRGYRLFGRDDTCALPPEGYLQRFLE